MRHATTFLFLTAAFLTVSSLWADDAVSLDLLLDDMTERDKLCEWPNPEYVCRQASSYDRAAVSSGENWFANADCSQFLREEENNGRREWVLMEADGPGAIVRFWITAPNYVNHLYFYIDNAAEPVIAGASDMVIGGSAVAPSPLSQETARGRNLYLPIPYAKSIKVTCDKIDVQPAFYYQINYRTYAHGTPVESFSQKVLADEAEKIAETCAELDDFASATDEEGTSESVSVTVAPSASSGSMAFYGPKMITHISAKIAAEDLASALRSTLVRIAFDGMETVYVPLGDFFGGGVGLNPYKTRYTEVREDGTFICRWPMPFQRLAEIELVNVGDEPVTVNAQFTLDDEQWSDRSMYFHANWRQQRGIETVAGNGTSDWNYLGVAGKGVYVGDSLSLVNRDPAWWGEGDEKIYVDGEKFPSHFGTGTEDYYGYAWGTPAFFDSMWRAQPRAEGPASYGNVTNLRFRALDAIPFTSDFRFDLEIWHWAKTVVDYSAVTYWYGFPGAKGAGVSTPDEIEAEAAAPVAYQTPFVLKLDGYQFADDSKPINGRVELQAMAGFGSDWKENRQLFWTGGKPSDKISLLVNVEKENPATLRLGLTTACDYAIAQVWLDGEKLGCPFDLFNAAGVIHQEQVFGALPPLSAGEHRLDFEIVGKNEKSVNYFFGTDSIVFE